MVAEKGLWLTKKHGRLVVSVGLCCLLLLFSLTGFAFSSLGDSEPELVILGPNVKTYDLDAVGWEFPLTLVGFGPGARTARLAEFTVNNYNLLPLVPAAQRTIPVHRLDGDIGRAAFRQWNNYRQRAAVLRVRNDERIALSATEAREFGDGNTRMRGIMRRRGDIVPVVLSLNVQELPFRVTADGHYRVRVVVERGELSSTWEAEVLIVDVEPVASNPVWLPADLHLHSTFALDGRFEPRELAPMLANRGYSIGYITDEPVGAYIATQPIPSRMSGTGRRGSFYEGGTNIWLTYTFGSDRAQYFPWLATWETYSEAVRNASTSQVAMFPGAEIAASTMHQQHGNHDGHALAYGIQNLNGSNTFETTGLRYCWVTPNHLLANINNNQLGRASASIAHPVELGIPGVPTFEWNDWRPVISARYDGFELMYAGQTRFGPSEPVATKWREEIAANLSRAFAGDGFPSARTGSDWGGAFSQLWDISYFTYVGLSSLPGDMRNLSQADVDQALRAGRTVASRLGGLATLWLWNEQAQLKGIGSQFAMPSNSIVSGHIELRAARSGNYSVQLIQNLASDPGLNAVNAFHNRTASVFSQHLNAGQTVIIPANFVFMGGQRAFHLVVTHSSVSANDIIYTSPIFIRQ